MPGNQERTGRYQREGQFRPQQQYDEEGGYRDDWARGYGGSGANDPEGQ